MPSPNSERREKKHEIKLINAHVHAELMYIKYINTVTCQSLFLTNEIKMNKKA